jgi:glycosyltransferase involved in cell wall biosynthesis
MRIAMISTPFIAVPPRDYGGTELIVHELVEGLQRRGHEVTLFATGDSRTVGNLEYLFARAQWPPEPMTDFNHVTWAMQRVAERGFEVVHSHSAAALALRRLVRTAPLVYTMHHPRDERLSAFYHHCHDAHFVAISADQAGREIPLPSLTVIHHGLDPAHYACTDRLGDYVCFISRLAPVKGSHTAIDVCAQAGVQIRVAGGVHPPDREYVGRELGWRLNQPHVRYLGTIGADIKQPLLRDARALLAPIEWNEPFGLVLIEAMLSGCPVVAYGRGSVPELVEDGVTGYVVSDARDMADLIRPGGPLDDFDRARCRARAVERFSSARMVEEYERLYLRISTERPLLHPVSGRVA